MQLKVICLNLWLGGKLFDNIKEFIAQEKADIIALQEVYHAETDPPEQEWHIVGNLARIFGYEHFAFVPAFGRTEPSGFRILNGNAVFSKFPIKSSTATFYDVPMNTIYPENPEDARRTPRNLQHCEIDINGKILHFFNTQGVWGFDGNDNERRLQMGDTIAQEVANKSPALLMGDFNTQEGTQSIAKIEKHMTSIFKGEMKTSFNLEYKKSGGFATAVVDMMFMSPGVKVLSHHVSQANVSDHLSLVAEFEIA
jgi:endonuclease/exonuclease/phosphatase family metal-dependent hydrolase